MSPSVFVSKNNSNINGQTQKYNKTKEVILKYQEFIKKNFNDVGKNFAHEARTIHYKEKKLTKGIFGTATKEEINELKEEGIETEVIPWIKHKSN